jgi:hypothetical protein
MPSRNRSGDHELSKRQRLRVPLVAAALLAPAIAAGESSYQCANGVVSVGDAGYTVLEKCGRPSSSENIAGGGAEETDEYWYYGGGGKLPYALRIQAGKLVSIDRLQR